MAASTKRLAAESSRVSGKKLWAFRLGAALGLPLLGFLLIELTLRWAGVGQPTSFLLPDRIGGQEVWVSNPRFGWRFFGERQARAPRSLVIPRTKPANTIRVFVFGESAAFGDPQPDFGLPRLLEAVLTERYPQTHFEVVNAAMTAINSHVVLPIARDCARADGDLWVIYMGNNEVVGPFGAGTVFGAQTPPLPVIRASLALKATRTGQWLESLLASLSSAPASKAEWGGLLMFMENQIRRDDPRLLRMYSHFEHNLRDIIQAGRETGVGVVVSTVAVNLKDCAPFASVAADDLNAGSKAKWQEAFDRGAQAQASGDYAAALQRFNEAAALKDDVAELEFRRGQCWLAHGEITNAQASFRNARDLDTLRFRCDSRLNDITRRVAQGREAERVLLADSELEFARQVQDGVPGGESFYEHVHLTFEGNYLLARTLAASIEKLLPETIRRSAVSGGWPTVGQCARRLGWSDWMRRSALVEIAGRLSDPPFTQQSDHALQLARLNEALQQLFRRPASEGAREAEDRVAEALKLAPEDAILQSRLAGLLATNGKLEAAAAAAKRATELQPNNPDFWDGAGVVLARLNRNAEAADMFRHGLGCDPQNVFTRNNLAQVLVRMERKHEAQQEWERAIAIKPGYGTAHLGLGKLLEESGKPTEAETHYAAARQHRVNRPADLAILARFCLAKSWLADAATNFALAIRMSPADGSLRLDAGRCAVALGRNAEAADLFRAAVALMPESGEAHFLLGRELGRQHEDGKAAEEFQAAVRLLPDLIEARLNLAVARMNEGRVDAAKQEFEEVLRRQPGNELARQNLARLQSLPP